MKRVYTDGEIDQLVEALRFYSDLRTYLASWPEPHDQSSFVEASIESDRGELAREVLKKLEVIVEDENRGG